MGYVSFLTSILAIAIAIYFYWNVRRRQEISSDKLSDRISSLLSEFNSVTAANIDLLDDRTAELRRVIELADLKANKLERLIDRAEGVNRSLEKYQSGSGANSGSPAQSRREKVLDLARQGYKPDEIARRTGMKKGEVSVIVRLNRSRNMS